MKKLNRCQRCGWCCKSFPITHNVALNIMKYLDKNPHIIKELDISKPAHGECIFLKRISQTATCMIYDSGIRPIICDAMATKGYAILTCPNGTLCTKYTAEEADRLISQEISASPTVGDLNEVISRWVIKYKEKHHIK